MADVNTGNATVRLEVAEAAFDRNDNTSLLAWNLWFIERVSSPTSWSGGGINWSVREEGVGTWASGTFGFDFRPGGLQSILIASGSLYVSHNADGSRYVDARGYVGPTGSSAAPGNVEVQQAQWLTHLYQVPSVPAGVTATRVSDTQTNLTWTNGSNPRGQATAIAIDIRINGGTWQRMVNMGNASSASVSAGPNARLEYRVAAGNSQGYSDWGYSNTIFTTPGDPSNVTAVKDAALDININFTRGVSYGEHTHEVWHGTVTGGVTTWDGAPLATLGSNVTTYKHVAPNAAQVHIYRVRARAGALASGYATSAPVQLLVAPNKPTFQPIPQFADKATALTFGWVHNSVDSTPQSAYEVGYSTNGGTTWTSSGKVASTVSLRTIAANAYAANTTVTLRVRTWGSATSGGSDGTGASPWSDLATVTFKTVPTASITAPTNGADLSDSTLRVNVGFTQPEGATFVKAQLQLLQGATLLEEMESTIQVGITMATALQNAGSYTVRARVQDSNGLWSSWVSNNFTVTYLAPVPAVASTSYLPDTGYVQIDLAIAAPGGGQAAATTVTITRSIDGGPEEVVVADYPAAASLAFLDTTPTIHGTNTYTITTKSAQGSQTVVSEVMVTEECRRAYLSKGAGFGVVVVFGANLEVSDSLSVASATVDAAGRTKPIGLYGVEQSVQIKVKSFIFEREGFSTLSELRDFLLLPGKSCYRDSSGRRVFGVVKGSVAYKKTDRGDLNFTMTETS